MSSPIEAASVLLCRSASQPEWLLVHRAIHLRFLGGFVAFPGGKTHDDDLALARPADGLTHLKVAAIRELFEETGVLLARLADGSFPPPSESLQIARRALLEQGGSFPDLCRQHGWHLHPGDLQPVGRLITPPFAPLRFDTTFYAAELPPGQSADIWPGELSTGQWTTAAAALHAWRDGTLPLSPPTYAILAALIEQPVERVGACLQPLLARLDAGALPDIWFSPGVRVLPLESDGLPPTTHTNAYLVGTDRCYLIDPGPSREAEQQRLFASLTNCPLTALILTHHHPDHVGAARACAERFGVPIWAHRLTAERLAGRLVVDRLIEDGEVLPLGRAPHGRGDWALHALFTPGHAPGHLAFYEPDYRLLFAGDLVSPLSSLIIGPADGDLALYLESLRRIRALPIRLLLPAHGGPTLRAEHLIDETLSHRATRERQLLEALAVGPRSLDELTGLLYRGFPVKVQELGQQQIHANLLKLQREGRVRPHGERWQIADTATEPISPS
jgi:ribonuclease/clavin/mitogillin